MRSAFIVLLVIHSTIHFLGFATSRGYSGLGKFSQAVLQAMGVSWLIAGICFAITTLLYVKRQPAWKYVSVVSIVISQILVAYQGHNAFLGTVVNVVVLLVTIVAFTTGAFEKKFEKDVASNLERTNKLPNKIITAADLENLPTPVSRYLLYVGVLNKPVIKNMHVVLGGKMRGKGQSFFSFTAEQYNFFDIPVRLFFMKAVMFGIKIPGYHKYANGTASMNIKPFGIFSMVKKKGEIMFEAETVTFFQEMCLLAPASLVSKNIQWKTIDDLAVEATFKNRNVTVRATLHFNEEGQLVNFVSDDRTDINDMQKHPFSTPVATYQYINGYNLMKDARAVWQYPDEDFTYAQLCLKAIEYNVTPEYQ